ncbi:uridine kinase family protein [Actinokineospora sp.]|uniref:uridine kinase family protein n=1 Tax=Actinokineospora sp. TaxID=1872133 RepID=UPI0040378032
MTSSAVRATAILLAGPSGSGKSTLAAGLGLPVLRLDDFYREGHDPLLPRDAAGRVDWDTPESWHAEDALAAVVALATSGAVDVPRYAIEADRRVGSYRLELGDTSVFLAEGLFADRIVAGARHAGVLADAVVLAPGGGRTFVRRFARDVAESRKAVPVLMRRGLRLWREHAAVVRRCESAGMRRCTPAAHGLDRFARSADAVGHPGR